MAPPVVVLPIRLVQAAPQSIDLSLQGWILSAVSQAQGKVPRLASAAPQLIDLTTQGWIDGTSQPTQGRVPALIQIAPQQADLSLKASLFFPLSAPPIFANPIKLISAWPQGVDLTVQGWVRGASPPAQAKVPALINAGPQWLDLTVQGWIDGTAQPLQAKVPGLINAAPQFIDLTLQSLFTGTAGISAGFLRGEPRYIIKRLRMRRFTVSATSYLQFEPKAPDESVELTFDFSPDLAEGVALAGVPTLTVTMNAGSDPTPASIANGSPGVDVTATKVIVPVTAGLDACDYNVHVRIATTDPLLILSLTGILPVRS